MSDEEDTQLEEGEEEDDQVLKLFLSFMVNCNSAFLTSACLKFYCPIFSGISVVNSSSVYAISALFASNFRTNIKISDSPSSWFLVP